MGPIYYTIFSDTVIIRSLNSNQEETVRFKNPVDHKILASAVDTSRPNGDDEISNLFVFSKETGVLQITVSVPEISKPRSPPNAYEEMYANMEQAVFYAYDEKVCLLISGVYL